MNQPLLSIIIPTLYRVNQLEALLESIIQSKYQNYEILIIDQNFSTLLDNVVDIYSEKVKIKHHKVDFRSLSKAKNYGANLASGDIFCFPDDDSEVFENTFSTAIETLQKTQTDVVFGKCVDRNLSDSVVNFENNAGYLSLHKFEGMFVDATMFIRREVLDKYRYDESFGVGTFYGAEEGYDLVLRMLNGNIRIFYSPEIIFYHPQKILNYTTTEEIKRVFQYRCGFAHLCLKHQMYKKLYSRILKVTIYIFYLVVFSRKKVRYYAAELLGILVGITVR